MSHLVTGVWLRTRQRSFGELPYMILNLGISPNFGFIDFEHLTFLTTMSVDYVRVYQNPDNINIGCEPDGFPTQAYIEKYVLFLSTLHRSR